MDILMSLHKKWADKIFDGSKTLEFRKKIGKDFKVGDIVYENRNHRSRYNR